MGKRKSIAQLERAAQTMLKEAKKRGIENSFLFETTFQRYLDHIKHLEELQAAIEEHGSMVTKEYVRGRENLYVNPAIAAYNQTAGAADKAAQLLLRCIADLPAGGGETDEFDRF